MEGEDEEQDDDVVVATEWGGRVTARLVVSRGAEKSSEEGEMVKQRR